MSIMPHCKDSTTESLSYGEAALPRLLNLDGELIGQIVNAHLRSGRGARSEPKTLLEACEPSPRALRNEGNSKRGL